VLSVRREILDHVVVINADHHHLLLLLLLREYVAYHHEDRCHLSLGKDTPFGRAVTPRPAAIVSGEGRRLAAFPGVSTIGTSGAKNARQPEARLDHNRRAPGPTRHQADSGLVHSIASVPTVATLE
jgi:hypothetical protein